MSDNAFKAVLMACFDATVRGDYRSIGMSETIKRPVKRCKCGGTYEFSRHCGADVCPNCDDHKGLARCYCGWSLTQPGNGYNELIEMGETIEPEDGGFYG